MASDARMPTAKERASIRDAHRQMIAARRRADAVTRPDGCDSLGHPGIAAANLGGSLGGRAVALLDSLEAVEAERDEARRERDEARAEAEKLRETLASVGVPLEALRLANRDVPGWVVTGGGRWRGLRATDAIRRALSGGEGLAAADAADPLRDRGRSVPIIEQALAAWWAVPGPLEPGRDLAEAVFDALNGGGE